MERIRLKSGIDPDDGGHVDGFDICKIVIDDGLDRGGRDAPRGQIDNNTK